ncbi:MAG: phosphoribosylanthranilate isomerase [Anaerolineales bacterium]|nr:phosphoribosylanthranilate isomerase [Anaerolineales bacterium]
MLRIKICGITNLSDALTASAAGADYLGFILHPKSPRYIAPEAIRTVTDGVRARLPASMRPRLVGVFVNTGTEQVIETVAACGLDLAQLHGDESPEEVVALAGRGYKALRPQTLDQALAGAEAYWRYGVPDGPRLLVDAYHPESYGGTGMQGDWAIAETLAQRYPGLLLAGGLTPASVGGAVAAVRPWGVDVSSGVEVKPGKKDHAKIRTFVEAALAVI